MRKVVWTFRFSEGKYLNISFFSYTNIFTFLQSLKFRINQYILTTNYFNLKYSRQNWHIVVLCQSNKETPHPNPAATCLYLRGLQCLPSFSLRKMTFDHFDNESSMADDDYKVLTGFFTWWITGYCTN